MITMVNDERRYFDRNGLEITEGCEIRFLHGDRSLERVEKVYLCEDGQLGTDATNPAWVESGRAAPCEWGIYPLTREDTEGCELAVLSRERMDMGEYLRDVDGTMCICHEAVKPGFMRMAVEAWFEPDGEIYRKAHMLVPIDMPSEDINDLAEDWLSEVEKELGLPEGESASQSYWSVGYQLNADQPEHEYEYDWLVAEYCEGDDDIRFEALKSELFRCGTEAIEDFLGYEPEWDDDKDSIDEQMDDVYEQMPEDVLEAYYKDYKIGPVRELAGDMVVCYEAGVPGMMRLSLDGCFGPEPEDNRSTLMLIPMDMASEDIDMLSDMWLTEQEKEMGLPVGEACSSSSWWAGSKDCSHDHEITSKYDFLVERCYNPEKPLAEKIDEAIGRSVGVACDSKAEKEQEGLFSR